MYSQNIKEENSINTLRLLAAFQVMWGHMIVHLNVASSAIYGEQVKIIRNVLGYFCGVPLFFFISGYLIKFSVEKSKNAKDFFQKRFLRIYPELWVGIIIEILTILIFYKEKIEWIHLGIFAVTQGTILQFWTPGFLKDYGCGTPNGSLWTICVTVQFYIFIWVTKKLWSRKGIAFWVVSTVAFMALGACTGIIERQLSGMVYRIYCQTLAQYLWIFWLGLATAQYADRLLPVLKKYWWVGIGIFVVWKKIGIDVYARSYPIFMTIVSCLGCLGMAYKFPRLNIKIDISYAMFIYHMIFVNVMIAVGWTGVSALIVTTAITLLSAYLSTIIIGKGALKKSH